MVLLIDLVFYHLFFTVTEQKNRIKYSVPGVIKETCKDNHLY